MCTTEKNKHSSNSETKGAPHTRIRLPRFRDSIDYLDILLDRWELVCNTENLDRKYWATKIAEFFQGSHLNLILSLKLEDHHSYDKIREALLLRFSYNLEGLHKPFYDSLPEKKNTFIEYSSNLQRLFDIRVKASNIEQTYTALRELVFTSNILDSVDKSLYTYIIEQKPTPIEALIIVAVNVCEARPVTPFSKPSTSPPEVACAQVPLNPCPQQFTNQQSANNPNQGKKNTKKKKFFANQ